MHKWAYMGMRVLQLVYACGVGHARSLHLLANTCTHSMGGFKARPRSAAPNNNTARKGLVSSNEYVQ